LGFSSILRLHCTAFPLYISFTNQVVIQKDVRMKVTFAEVDRETLYLLPPSIQDWLPEKHLARFVVEIVEQIDLRHLKASYSGRGSQPYNTVGWTIIPNQCVFGFSRILAGRFRKIWTNSVPASI
jgi:hypothetical protein